MNPKLLTLSQEVEAFIKTGHPRQFPDLLVACLKEGGTLGLSLMQKLFEDMYGGMTFNYEIKAPAAYCLLAWGAAGLDALVEAADRTPTFKNVSLALELLALCAADGAFSVYPPFVGRSVQEIIDARMRDRKALFNTAKNRLRRMILAFETDDDAAHAVAWASAKLSIADTGAPKQLFMALCGRWLAVSTASIKIYDRLLRDRPDDEPTFQSFFEEHPQLLDPMALEVWPTPDLHGFAEPDFIICRTDDSYLIVEIETPAKMLVTSAGQVSAQVTQAVSQVAGYRSFLLERFAEAQRHFPGFHEPDGLVVIGLEANLTQQQANVLRLDNEHRRGIRVVGFDWIGRRAEAIAKNIVENEVGVKLVRMV